MIDLDPEADEKRAEELREARALLAERLAVARGRSHLIHKAAASGDWRAVRMQTRLSIDVNRSTDVVGDTPLIVAAASDKAVRVLDAAAGRCAREIADAHARPPHALAAPRSSDHDVFASAAVDGVVALWDLRSQNAVARFSAHACRRDPTTIAFSPCMRYLATGSEDKAAYVYDVRRGINQHAPAM